ncbi:MULTISPECIES: bacteriohemerythrin [unclassified Ectothiorhodospira]|uniref:bacteriohemerythrin n=1 Tax=unclassified Ectothiorhodospira TaxID=2684909 RepID=UPI001EE80484|nr:MULTISPECIES: hemerythrin family protein [unclassified Ectothiorhodospira]MCG5516155.1 hemerythrin family protein [Ectothiorhodospira sp. 9100]MCG5520150.1 hemerythrin family protein [Ectothiorhodospira sp. 9905]
MSEHARIGDLPQVGVEFMDDDHEEAMGLLARVVETLEASRSDHAAPESLRRDLRDFIEHSRAHFRREEVIMKAVHFPPFHIHKNEHDQRLEELVTYVDDLDSGVIGLEDLKDKFLNEFLPWYQRHCATMDQATARYVEKQAAATGQSKA